MNVFIKMGAPLAMLAALLFMFVSSISIIGSQRDRISFLHSNMTQMFDDYCGSNENVAALPISINWGKEYNEFEGSIVIGCADDPLGRGWLVYNKGELFYISEPQPFHE